MRDHIGSCTLININSFKTIRFFSCSKLLLIYKLKILFEVVSHFECAVYKRDTFDILIYIKPNHICIIKKCF